MKKWKVDYAYRVGGKYCEDDMFVIAMYADKVLAEANSILNLKAYELGWDVIDNGCYHDRFFVWNIGLVAEADEEVF